jgi:hypothetical protein
MAEPRHHHTSTQGTLRSLFSQVAFWQALGFLSIIAFAWVREVLDLPHVFFGEPPSPVDWIGASIISAGVIVIGFIITAHTYLQQQSVLKGYIRVCSYCRKVHVEDTNWEQMEQFISERTLAEFTHGICPSCLHQLSSQMADGRPTPEALPRTAP